MQTIVIGHRNPDMDSICSAIAYADLKRKLGMENVTAARAGNTNERIDLVLEKFGVPAPEFLSDVAPKVEDVMETQFISVAQNSSIYHAMNSFEKQRIRGLPVVDERDRCLGLLSGWKVSQYFFPQREDARSLREIFASVSDVVRSFNGEFIVGVSKEERQKVILMSAAMSLRSFGERLRENPPEEMIVFVGDREDIQLEAIRNQSLAVVITGGMGLSANVRTAAREVGVRLIVSQYDTATTILLARGAAKIDSMIDPQFTSLSPDTPLKSARHIVAASSEFVFPILESDKRLVGILRKSDFIKPIPRQLILVDHNELSQAVTGADELQIIEVLDHHRLASFKTDLPILFWNNPVGSTSTLVTLSFQQHGIEIQRPIAGLLMAGLISDTLNLTSPTATPIDAKVLETLSKIAGVDPAALSESIFAVGSPLLTLDPAAVILADCKDYSEDGQEFSVSQIEELGFSHFYDKQEALFKELEAYRSKKESFFAALLVTDVNTQNSLLMVSGPAAFLDTITYPRLGSNLFELQNVVSRKKQLVPYLLDCLHKVRATIS
ncbi:MAG TPA: putative manganese-dependent inorganic diphosphatase [Chthoniobacterales bacterium]|jgi:manganese-dependent inorganic pyrophosphatase|nr:putative manganese-dependent inorganic diphosphatase [Chthoniobacterales bacterium]